MFDFKTVSAVLVFCAIPLAAAQAGHVQSAQSYYSGSSSASAFGPVGTGNLVGSSANFAPGSANVNISGPSTGNLNVQTNIDNTKSINSSSSISDTETINGTDIGYGLGGSNVLNVINAQQGQDANVSAEVKNNAAQAMQTGLIIEQMEQAYGDTDTGDTAITGY